MFGKVRDKEKPKLIISMLQDLNCTEDTELMKNREVVKIFIRAAHFIIKKMLSNITYPSLVQLLAECGPDVLRRFHLKAPKNANYMSVFTFKSLVVALNRFVEEPLICSLEKANSITIFHDETTDISNKSEACVYCLFFHKGIFKEHFIGLLNMSHSQTAESFYEATKELCAVKKIDMSRIQFSSLDGCATNTGGNQGFNLYFTFHNPHHIHQTCLSHRLALIPKHKIKESQFKVVLNADKTLVSLASYFSQSSIRNNIFEECQTILEVPHQKLHKPCPTRWLTHDLAVERLDTLFESTLMSLVQIYEDRHEPDALGLIIEMIDTNFILCNMMLGKLSEKYVE